MCVYRYETTNHSAGQTKKLNAAHSSGNFDEIFNESSLLASIQCSICYVHH